MTLRQSLIGMSSALDEASAELDKLAMIAGDEPNAVEIAVAVIFHRLADLINREAARVTAQRHP